MAEGGQKEAELAGGESSVENSQAGGNQAGLGDSTCAGSAAGLVVASRTAGGAGVEGKMRAGSEGTAGYPYHTVVVSFFPSFFGCKMSLIGPCRHVALAPKCVGRYASRPN